MMDEKIEEMAKIISSDICDKDCSNRCAFCGANAKKEATALYNAGYRKESDAAREILAEIDDLTLCIIDGSNEFEKGYFQAIADMKTAIKDLLKEKYEVE
jgi:biotin synthase-like enzyme